MQLDGNVLILNDLDVKHCFITNNVIRFALNYLKTFKIKTYGKFS